MEIDLIEKGDKSKLIRITGADHTLTNLLRAELHESGQVEVASYSVEHPLTGAQKFFVKTKGKSPERAMTDAAEHLIEKLDEVKKEFQKALKSKS